MRIVGVWLLIVVAAQGSSMAGQTAILTETLAIDFIKPCEELLADKEHSEAGVCLGYASGYVEALEMTAELKPQGRLLCLPSNGFSALQAVRIFLKYASDHPEQLHQRIGRIFGKAMIAAFPCPKA